MKFYRFYDMHSGGYMKAAARIYVIEAPDENVAVALFRIETGCDPYDVECDCCGPNYSITDHDTLMDATEEYGSTKQSVGERIESGRLNLIIDTEVSFI